MSDWKVIGDNYVRHYWKCETCGNSVYVGPQEYQDIGTPVCTECDCDMTYYWTEVKNG